MVEKEMLVKATNKVETPIYYLGQFAMLALDRIKVPDVDARQNQFLESIKICSDNGYRVRNKRQNTARTSSSNKRQESSASKKGSKKSSVTPTHHRQRRVNSIRIQPYSPPTKNHPKIPLMHPPKIKTTH
jgi:hypothetical protein